MERNRVFRILTHTAVVVVLLGLATAPVLKAEFACKQELMTGAWMLHANLVGQGAVFGKYGNWSALALYVWDEQGFATTAIQTNTHAGELERIDFLERFDVQVTVKPDCTGKFTFTNKTSAVLVFDLDTVCANGQRECYATFTQTPPPGNTDPVGLVGVLTLKKVDATEGELEARLNAKLDTLSEKIHAIMSRLGLIVPPADDNK